VSQENGSLVLVGKFRDDAMGCVEEVAASLGIRTALVGRCEEAPEVLAEAAEPLAVVVQMDAEGAPQLFAHVRGQARLVQLPILARFASSTNRSRLRKLPLTPK